MTVLRPRSETPGNKRQQLISTLFFCLTLLLWCAFGCTSSPRQGSPVYSAPSAKDAPRSVTTMARDAVILTRIKSKIFSDDLVSQGDADITVRHGVVYLEGTAVDHYQGRMLADLIRTVDGVVRVENRLTAVRTGTRFVSHDEFVTGKIKMSFLKDQDLNQLPIIVETTADKVVLKGNVASQVLKQKAQAIAGEFAGDRQVINQLTVSP